jgi:single-stranded-DNA-specific exonuclease
LLNSHRQDDAFAFKGLASCGVAFYLAAAVRSRLRAEGKREGDNLDPRSWLDLVALGTIADLVPLTDENRILVAAGLRELGRCDGPALPRWPRSRG